MVPRNAPGTDPGVDRASEGDGAHEHDWRTGEGHEGPAPARDGRVVR